MLFSDQLPLHDRLWRMSRCAGGEGALPALPGEIMRDILARLAYRWARRPVRLAKEEIREWTQYTLVCKEWQALFQAQPLCVVFDEVRASPGWHPLPALLSVRLGDINESLDMLCATSSPGCC